MKQLLFIIMLHLPLVGMQLVHYGRLAKTVNIKNNRAFSTNQSEREKLLEKATPNLWRIYASQSLYRELESAKKLEDTIFKYLPLKGGLLRENDSHYYHKKFKAGENKHDKLIEEALRLAPKTSAAISGVFLSHDNHYALISDQEKEDDERGGKTWLESKNSIIDLKNKCIHYDPYRLFSVVNSVKFSESNSYIFSTSGNCDWGGVTSIYLGFISLIQKGSFVFRIIDYEGAYSVLASDPQRFDISINNRGLSYPILKATISPDGQHLLTYIKVKKDNDLYEKLLWWTIEHKTCDLTDKQLELIASLPLEDEYYKDRLTIREMPYFETLESSRAYVPFKKTLLSKKDKDVFMSLPEDLQENIKKLYNLEINN